MAVVVFAEIGNSWKTSASGSASYELYATFDPVLDNELDVQAAIQAALPNSYVGFAYRHVQISEVAFGLCKGKATYSRGEATAEAGSGPVSDPSEFSFEIDSAQVKVFSSFQVMASVNAAGEVIPDNGTLIGVQPDGTIEGIDVPQMTYNFSEVHSFRNVSNAYKTTLSRLVGTVNFGGAFREAGAGEAMLVGVSGSQQGEDFWKLRFRWSVIPNMVSQVVGPFTINKAGWDYIEFFTRDTENVANKRVEKKLTGYKVHRVIRTGNFSLLRLGS